MDNIKNDQTDPVATLVRAAISDWHLSRELRSGQALFNRLPLEVGRVVSGQQWDPYQRNLSAFELSEWINKHIVFDGCEIVAVFNNDDILWERM